MQYRKRKKYTQPWKPVWVHMPSRTFILEYETDEGKDNYESFGQNVCIVLVNANQHDYDFSPRGNPWWFEYVPHLNWGIIVLLEGTSKRKETLFDYHQ